MQTTWQHMPFVNEARRDGLQLHHWTECYKDAAGQTRPVDEGPYVYAKYNAPAGAVRYDDVEFEQVIRPRFPEAESGWSKVRFESELPLIVTCLSFKPNDSICQHTCEFAHAQHHQSAMSFQCKVAPQRCDDECVQEETDYLLDLCERLELRFVVIADRYSFPGGRPRTLEDLKQRYYSLAAELTKARAGEPLLASNQPLIRQPYDAQKERERREFLRISLARTPAQVRPQCYAVTTCLMVQRMLCNAPTMRLHSNLQMQALKARSFSWMAWPTWHLCRLKRRMRYWRRRTRL